jgi:soluble lytic murein transglycosylase-like protein
LRIDCVKKKWIRPTCFGLGVALWWVVGGPPSLAQAGAVYRFVDEHGVVHLSNVPSDPRYRSYRPTAISGTLGAVPPVSYTNLSDYRRYDDLFERASHAYGLSPALIKAVVRTESNFKADAVSRKGARGLMQLMPKTAAQLGVRDAFRPSENVLAGTRYLRSMLDRYGDVRYALAAYNAGPTAVDRYGGIPPYPETRQYVKRVMRYYRRYDRDFE